MKRITLAIVLLTVALGVGAQTWNVTDDLREDRQKASGCEGPYRFDAPALTPAPKGYKPFYIGGYARHGSRYAWNDQTYSRIRDRLQVAHDAGALTSRGEQLYKDFMDFYLEPYYNTGDLVDLGWEQHTRIGHIMAREFPTVFKGKGKKITARCSVVGRSIVSMGAFCLALQKDFPTLDIVENVRQTNMPVTANGGARRELRKPRAGRPHTPGGEGYWAFAKRKTDREAILDRLVTDASVLGDEDNQLEFVFDLHDLWGGYHNYTDSNFLEDLFTPQQAVDLWEVANYSDFLGHSFNRLNQIELLQDIERLADEAVAGGDHCADFRFGHDYVLNAFFPLLNIGGSAYVPDKADDVKFWFQNYNTPMASNIQFVLYRSKKTPDDILFMVLHNGAEAIMPQFTPVSGPYYRWSDFKQWAAQLYSAHPVEERK